jgi:hypothetical protein
MNQWPTTDLFAPPLKAALTSEQRIVLRKLLEVLLREAMDAAHRNGAEGKEAGDDKHHT